MHRLSVRTADVTDIPALSDVYVRSSWSNDGDRAALAAHPEVLVFDAAAVHEGRTRVATEGARIVGFATVRAIGAAAELDAMFVDPDSMRRGVGRLLVDDAMAVVGSQGLARLEVTANAHAADFYRAAGFVRDGPTATAFGVAERMHLDVPPQDGRNRS